MKLRRASRLARTWRSDKAMRGMHKLGGKKENNDARRARHFPSLRRPIYLGHRMAASDAI